MLYSTDWQFDKKTTEGVKMYIMPPKAGTQMAYVRYEAKFGQVTVSELVEYFTDVDKRLAWENNNY